MSTDISQAIGYQQETLPVSWNKRDLLLYAIGIGAKKDDLSFVYELDKNFTPFPTYPVVLAFKGVEDDVTVFAERFRGQPIPGLPKFNPNRVVHGTQSIEILKPLPAVSGPGWQLKKRVVGVHENKSGVIIEQESILVDSNGTEYAKLFSGSFNIGAKVTGDKFSKAIAGPPAAKAPPKDRQPDFTVTDVTTPEQAVIYRLSGDYNPLHIDPAIGKAANFGGTILHGLSTFGFAARAVLSTPICANDANSLKYVAVRFTSPVKPGDKLETQIWVMGEKPDGTIELSFVTKNLSNGKICLGAGAAFVKKSEKSKL